MEKIALKFLLIRMFYPNQESNIPVQSSCEWFSKLHLSGEPAGKELYEAISSGKGFEFIKSIYVDKEQYEKLSLFTEAYEEIDEFISREVDEDNKREFRRFLMRSFSESVKTPFFGMAFFNKRTLIEFKEQILLTHFAFTTSKDKEMFILTDHELSTEDFIFKVDIRVNATYEDDMYDWEIGYLNILGINHKSLNIEMEFGSDNELALIKETIANSIYVYRGETKTVPTNKRR